MKEKFFKFFSNIAEKKFWVGILIFMLGQSIGYYGIKLFEIDFHTINSPIDGMIPFVPQMIFFYSIWYPFIFLILYYIYKKDYNVFRNGIIIGTIAYLITDIIFVVYPTIMVRPEVVYEELDFLTALLMKITYLGDNPAVNCFPSIHCLYCFHIMFMFTLLKGTTWRQKAFVYIMGLLIIASTVMVKQHYFYDIIGSLVLAILTNGIGYLLIRIKNNVKLEEKTEK